MTQSSSQARVKVDTVGDDGMKALFAAYSTETLESFRSMCNETIEQSAGKRTTKDKFHVEINRATSKDMMLRKVTNYLLAGQGLGV